MTIARLDFPDNSCLIVVDVQNDFVTGSLAVPNAKDAAWRCSDYIYDFRTNGDPFVYTMDFHKPDHPSFITQGGPWPLHCVEGTFGQELYRHHWPEGPFILKGYDEESYSGFEITVKGRKSPLELFLIYNKIKYVYVCGLAFDYCVKETALDAKRLGFITSILIDATAAVAPDSRDKAWQELLENGVNLLI